MPELRRAARNARHVSGSSLSGRQCFKTLHSTSLLSTSISVPSCCMSILPQQGAQVPQSSSLLPGSATQRLAQPKLLGAVARIFLNQRCAAFAS